MARMKSTKTIDEKIREQEEKLRKTKERCDKISGELDYLYEEKKALESKELLDAIARSSKTRAEVLAFLES
jgi:septal ring factor EnvC (AmiA/AmiB activator)